MFASRFDGFHDSSTEREAFFQIGTPRALIVTWPDGRSTGTQSRGMKMFTSFSSVRETATLFAGAFISALLLVSAATSLPIA
jgi:hypothetical protein